MVKEKKIRIVNELAEKFNNYRTIALFNLTNVPTKLLKEIRRKIRGKGEMKVVKKKLMLLAMEKCEKVKGLQNFVPTQPAILFSNENPIGFLFEVEGVKIEDYAKEGDVAEEDIVLHPGPTNLPAGPVIGELSRAGIPVGVEGGKVSIKKEVTVVKKGEKFSKNIAAALRKLEIKPVKLGIKLSCIFCDGTIFGRETLDFAEKLEDSIKECYRNMLSFCLGIDWINKASIKYLLLKAYQNGRAIEGLIK